MYFHPQHQLALGMSDQPSSLLFPSEALVPLGTNPRAPLARVRCLSSASPLTIMDHLSLSSLTVFFRLDRGRVIRHFNQSIKCLIHNFYKGKWF